ncbi:EAL domain-containing protein [Legionella hackeliae]|uniref:cyclic-guanylate-specific phosphodiesterase n=1 Tax=Legionella hackeliae TaxID=449 RepID=A0A0A8US73_LEGHA|nr:EAL domain-containing protein [Legionella hackeliae]KTD13116.1 regulatory protein (EAL domain) [Legionella hackeliae]CEK11573.1 conserved protein of unknown function [EAL domain] [Legionella hackeliae]STX48346.1 regulatory protein (EAL domain) [Legionella hackeliae]
MRRIRIIIIAILLGAIGAILPMLGALYLAWTQALNEERQTLYEFSSRMLIRAQYTLNEARKLLVLLQEHPVARPCSDDHIQWMAELVTSKMDVKSIAYFENGIRCNNYGILTTNMPRYQTDFILSDGLEFAVNKNQSPDISIASVAFRKSGNYDIYVDSKRFSDIIVPNETWLAIVYSGKIITQRNTINPTLLKNILSRIPRDDLKKYTEISNGVTRLKPVEKLVQLNTFFIDQKMVSITQLGPFYFIATEPEVLVYERYKSLQLILLPFGFITAVFIIGLVIYYSLKRLSFRAELQEALRNDEFIVHYQPIIHTASGKCCGAEALIRWQRPNGQIVRPDLFIRYAEEAGLISPITDKIINKIFTELEKFLVQHRDLHVAINVAVEDIQTGRIVELLESKMMKSKIMRNQIWIELTERTFLEMEKAKKIIQRARQLGYIVVVDDFGTGFSSLSYLQNLPMDILKIDKSFIDSLGMEAATSSVTDHIIDMAKSLNLKLVAEGVEKKTQFEYLKDRNVDYIQGYLFSRPLTLQQFMRFFTLQIK